MQSALLRVCLERVVGDLALPVGTAVVAAANPFAETGDGWELTPPLANRFLHLEWQPTALQFAAGMAGHWADVPEIALGVGFEPELQRARNLIASFVLLRPKLLCDVPTAAVDVRGWPSPRSWEAAARAYAAARATSVSATAAELLVTGCVGPGAAAEFLAWRDDLELLDPREVLSNPDTVALPERADRLLALLTSIVDLAGELGDADSWQAAWRVLVRASSGRPDVAAISARDLARVRPDGASIPDAVLDQFLPLLEAAGLA